MLRSCLFLSVTLLATAVTSAAQPALSRLSPVGVQRGTESELSLIGARLGDAEELLFYEPGIEVLSLAAEKDNQVQVKLRIAAEARVGLHAVRLRTKTGLSDIRLLAVGHLPQISEEEPNSAFDSPQAISLGVTVEGVVQSEDVDYFVVEAKKGERITAEVEGLRLGYTFFDPYVAILNAERFELARSDDAALLRQDCVCSTIAPADGKYIIEVREVAYGGDGNSLYRLHVGTFPRPLIAFPPGGKPGESVEITWLGGPEGPWKQQVRLPETPSNGVGEVVAEDAHGRSPSANRLRVLDLDHAAEVEPNNALGQAAPMPAPGAAHGIISEPGDIDCFKFTAKKGQQYDIRVYARETLRSPLDSVLNVYRAENNQRLGGNDDNAGMPDSYQRVSIPADGDYIIRVNDHLGAGGETFVYRVEVTPVAPELTLSLPEKQRYVATTLTVPRGNRQALMVNAERRNFGGDLRLLAENLPEGVEMQVPTVTGGSVPVLFTAKADAPLTGRLVDLKATTIEEGKNVSGRLSQRTMLVRGQNNRDVWGHDAERMAAATIEKVPFQIEIVQPQVPIVRDGSMRLKVVAQREEGFDAEIAIQMLYNPSGIGSSGSIRIAKGTNEAEIPLTANGGASIGVHDIIVTGSAQVGNGRIEVASQMAKLEIADKLFDHSFVKAAVELEQQTELLVKLTPKREFAGKCELKLLGLPPGLATESVEVDAKVEQATFLLTAAKDARVGKHTSLVVRATLMEKGEPIEQTLRGGELRVDKPLPPATAVAAKPKVEPKKSEPTAAKPKPLSRLEQLRRLKEQQANGK